jgi:hypothetical protein
MPHSTQPTTAAGGKRFGLLLPGVFTVLAASTIAAMVITSDSAPRREATLPAGTVLIAALDRSVSTKESRIGDAVRLETTEPVRLADEAVVPAGAVILGEVTHSQDGGRIAGAPELTLRFTELEADGERYRMDARPFRIRGKNDALESAAQIGGGAVAGGIPGRGAGWRRRRREGRGCGSRHRHRGRHRHRRGRPRAPGGGQTQGRTRRAPCVDVSSGHGRLTRHPCPAGSRRPRPGAGGITGRV